ncbi:hypothetical protein [Lacticaseibacillus camelliae]|uniref:ABC transporter permease n=1 Tax=Lacticaseibacillus camelliae DSM 22697 = JCM 13995 TaxID=1423730 RepID=A0A0R2F8K0_9LACO|nr:hypothetical protein [Lacticaseibacillus camelliae]KRN24478.1 ABC transporter permease [Lacticaseibacillus camelliae DSM 22697 = JCM 13995]
MKEKSELKVTVPAGVYAQLHGDLDTPMQLTIKNDRIVIQPAPADRLRSGRQAFIWPLVVSLISTVVIFLYWLHLGVRVIPMTGDVSVASFTIGFGVVTGIGLFAGFFVQSRNDPDNRFSKAVYWRNFPVIMLAFAIILGMALLGTFWVLGQLFPGATFDPFTAVLQVLIFLILANVFMVQMALRINASTLSTLLTIVIVSGAVISMASNGSRQWWQYNLSFLGTKLASNAWQFNLTLVMTALVMISLIDYLFVQLNAQHRKSWRLTTLRTLLTLAAIDLGCIGIFPNNAQFHLLHDQISWMLVTIVLIIIIGLRWLLPEVSKEFLWASYGIGAVEFLLNMGFRLFGYPSLTAFEIQGFAIGFAWLLFLFNRLQALIAEGTVAWPIVIECEPEKTKTERA